MILILSNEPGFSEPISPTATTSRSPLVGKFSSYLRQYYVMTLGKLFTDVPLLTNGSIWYYWPKSGDALQLGR